MEIILAVLVCYVLYLLFDRIIEKWFTTTFWQRNLKARDIPKQAICAYLQMAYSKGLCSKKKNKYNQSCFIPLDNCEEEIETFLQNKCAEYRFKHNGAEG